MAAQSRYGGGHVAGQSQYRVGGARQLADQGTEGHGGWLIMVWGHSGWIRAFWLYDTYGGNVAGTVMGTLIGWYCNGAS